MSAAVTAWREVPPERRAAVIDQLERDAIDIDAATGPDDSLDLQEYPADLRRAAAALRELAERPSDAAIARSLGITKQALWERRRRGWSDEDAMALPRAPGRSHKRDRMTIAEQCAAVGIGVAAYLRAAPQGHVARARAHGEAEAGPASEGAAPVTSRLDRVLDLLERFVIAQERAAEALERGTSGARPRPKPAPDPEPSETDRAAARKLARRMGLVVRDERS